MEHTDNIPPDWVHACKEIRSVSVDIFFLLKEKFRNEIALYQPKNATDRFISIEEITQPSDIDELIRYYESIFLAATQMHSQLNHNDVSAFWMRLCLVDVDDPAQMIPFPWYDSYREIRRFFDEIMSLGERKIWSDMDQSWDVEIYRLGDIIYFKHCDSDTDEVS